MKTKLHSLLFLLIITTMISISSPKIIQLSQQDFTSHIHKSPRLLIYFQPSLKTCKQCIVTEIEYKKLPNNTKLNQTGVEVAKIDVGQYTQIGKRYGVTNAPVIVLFDETFVVKYKGESTATSIANWVTQYFESRIIQIDPTTVPNIRKPYLVAKGQQQLLILNKALYDVDGITAYHADLDHDGIVIVHKNLTQNYMGELERIALQEWIIESIKNSITPLNDNKINEKILFNEHKPALVVFLSKEDKQRHDKYDIFLEICSEFADKINCGEILPKYESYVGVHGYFKVQDNQKSLIGLVKEKMNIAYRLDMPIQDANRISLVNFINGALADELERIVDNVAPTTAKFNHLKQPTIEQLEKIVSKNKYVFINYYDPTDQASLFFSRPYDSFANIVKTEDDLRFVEVLAVDCVKYSDYCAKKKFPYYPVLHLLINGVVVPYEKTEKLPEIPDLVRFLHDKVSKKITKFDENTQQLTPPYVVISCKKLPKELEALPALSPLIFYHKKSDQSEPQITLFTSEEQKVYRNELDAQKIISWVKQQTEQLLCDLLTENPDEKIMAAVKNKQPILIILDGEVNREESKKHRIQFGLICKKLNVVGGFADGRNRAYASLLQWVGLQPEQKSRIVYVDVSTDLKYLYQGDFDQLDAQSFKEFMDDVKAGKINVIGSEQQKIVSQETPEVQEL